METQYEQKRRVWIKKVIMWKELQHKIENNNINGSRTSVEWYSNGKYGKGKLNKISVCSDNIEFFIVMKLQRSRII